MTPARALAACLFAAPAGCATVPAPAPTPAAPMASPGGVYVRYFEGVLVLPADYVFDGHALPGTVRFQGPHGALRLGDAAQLHAGEYAAYAERTARSREALCGLEVLAHGEGEPTLWLLQRGTQYALAYDRDPAVVRNLLAAYCASRAAPAHP